jgi:bifunctional non-homologous end joining protein LigD
MPAPYWRDTTNSGVARAPEDPEQWQGGAMSKGEERDGVSLTNLDEPLFEGAGATKRDLVDYLDAVADRLVPVVADRPLSVVRVLRGQAPFMQKNVPKYTPPWVRTVGVWAERSHREVRYALCDDRRTLLWFGNQRAVEYHPMLVRAGGWDRPSYLILDLDPPETNGSTVEGFRAAVRAAHLVREALANAGLAGAAKTSGAKGVHVFVPLGGEVGHEEAAAATRAIAARAERIDPALATTAFIREDRGGKVFVDSTRAGGATVVAAYSPRLRPGVPVSFPLPWDELDRVTPRDFTVHTAVGLLAGTDRWAELMPPPQRLPVDLIEEGRTIPIARVQAMHEGKRRRARARADADADADAGAAATQPTEADPRPAQPAGAEPATSAGAEPSGGGEPRSGE